MTETSKKGGWKPNKHYLLRIELGMNEVGLKDIIYPWVKRAFLSMVDHPPHFSEPKLNDKTYLGSPKLQMSKGR